MKLNLKSMLDTPPVAFILGVMLGLLAIVFGIAISWFLWIFGIGC